MKDLNRDDAIDETLAALRRAAPPAGMETRISACIAQQIASPSPAPARIAPLIPSPAWWRGAFTGSATALLAIGLFLSTRHPALRDIGTAASSAERSTHQIDPASRTLPISASLDSVHHPCLRQAPLPAATRTLHDVGAPSVERIPMNETAAPSHPAPELPLTPQERQLVHLVRTTDPRHLAALGLNEEARLEAERTSDLSKFFAQPAAASAGSASPIAAPSATDQEPAPQPATDTQPSDLAPATPTADPNSIQEEQK